MKKTLLVCGLLTLTTNCIASSSLTGLEYCNKENMSIQKDLGDFTQYIDLWKSKYLKGEITASDYAANLVAWNEAMEIRLYEDNEEYRICPLPRQISGFLIAR